MKLTILGSGTYQPELERHSATYLVETNEGGKICFDFGRGAVDQLLKLRIRITELDAVFLSHWHGDHVADLVALLHYTVAPLPDDLSVFRPVRQKPLKIYGPKGTTGNIRAILSMTRFGKKEFVNLEVKDLTNSEMKENGLKIKSFVTDHTPSAVCYRIESEGRILAYSGDSIETDGLRKAIHSADLAVIEAGWPEKVNPKTHLTGPRAGKIAAEENVKKLVLTHIAPYYLKDFNPVKDAQTYFKGEILEAKDLMEIEI